MDSLLFIGKKQNISFRESSWFCMLQLTQTLQAKNLIFLTYLYQFILFYTQTSVKSVCFMHIFCRRFVFHRAGTGKCRGTFSWCLGALHFPLQ